MTTWPKPAGRQRLVESQLERVELGPRHRRAGRAEQLAAEARLVAVRHHRQPAEEVVGLPRRARLHAQHLRPALAADQRRHLRLHHGDVGVGSARLPQPRDEAPVVERPALGPLGLGPGVVWARRVLRRRHVRPHHRRRPHASRRVHRRVRDDHVVAVVDDVVAVAAHRVDVVEAALEPELPQRRHAARLHQLTDDAVRLVHPPLQQQHRPALAGQRVRHGASEHPRAHHHHVRLVVLGPPLLARVSGTRRRRHRTERSLCICVRSLYWARSRLGLGQRAGRDVDVGGMWRCRPQRERRGLTDSLGPPRLVDG